MMESTAVIKGLRKAMLLPAVLGLWCCPVLAALAEVHLYKKPFNILFFLPLHIIKYLYLLVAAEQMTRRVLSAGSSAALLAQL